MYIVVILQIITYVLFILALTLTHNSERKQYDLNKVCKKVIAKFKQENDSLRHENEDKTKFTLEHAKAFFQTFAEIEAEIHAPNVEIIAKVKEK